MSLFFANERNPKRTVTEPTPDWEMVLEAISKRQDPHVISALGGVTVEQAREWITICRDLERQLLQAIQAGTVTTQAQAADFLRNAFGGPFPASKFILRMRINVGSEANPASWAEVVAAAMQEDLG